MSTRQTPSISGVADPPAAPLMVSRTPNAIATSASTSLRRRCGTGGSGRFRIAAEIVITLTRHAENATTSSVSNPPIAKAMKRLRQDTKYAISMPLSSVPNALAMTSTMPYAIAAPSSAPTAAAITSYAAPSNVNI